MRLISRRGLPAALAVLVAAAGGLVWAVWPEPPAVTTEDARVVVRSGPRSDESIDLDTRLYLPANRDGKVPAVLLAHGFGGTKESVREDAEDLAELGYAVLTYSARGFGQSGGEIHLDHPDYEVRDAQGLLTWLAARPEVRTDGNGDPRVGVVGGSYGGALALLLAAQDQRVDAIVPMITWNDLARSFLPESTGRPDVDGVFKKGWAGLFFGSSGGTDPTCGRFAREVCDMYLATATTGRATPEAVELLRRSSPAPVLNKIKAPTLLIQGAADTLFPLAEADANAKGIAANGTPVRVAWYTGGHDGGEGPATDRDRLRFLTAQWLDHYVKGEGDAPSTSFTWSRVAGFDAMDRGLVTNGYSIDEYPSLRGTGTQQVALDGPPQPVANPPAGNPAAVSSLPGAGDLGGAADLIARDLPGQHGMFPSRPLSSAIDVVGAPTVSIRAASATGEAVLFVKLYDVDPDGNYTLPGGQVAPVRLTGLPADITQAQPITVTLPAIVRRIEAGHTLLVTVATSDQAYATPVEPAVYTVAVDGAGVSLPTVTGEPIATSAVLWRWVLAGLLAAVVLALAVVVLVVRRRHRRTGGTVVAEYADMPLVVKHLRKEYADGFVAVSDVDFTVARGQVVGLLGPNGAGKTTTLRVLMGLTQPTGGEIYVFGHPLVPGSPVLSRLGALVEGPGFLPHLSGLANLHAYWRATGRPLADARFDEAVEIAGLGDSIHRKVRKYSHGMKQRLAIAQAMLGLPELLVLDEPTDGLDPPQIAEMRRVLKRYATGGRAVLVSSHLLAEVEQTCTHAVVVNKGAIVASGPVDDIVGDSPTVQLDVSDVDAAEEVLDRLDAVRSVAWDGNGGLVVDIDGAPRSDVVAELVKAGVGVNRVVPRRRLEDAFLALVGSDTRGSGDR